MEQCKSLFYIHSKRSAQALCFYMHTLWKWKTKLVVLSSPHLFVLLKCNTNLGKFMYAGTKICHWSITTSNTNFCVIFHKCLRKHNPCEKECKFVLIVYHYLCLDSVEYTLVERLQCVLSMSSCIKQRFDLFLLITAVKDKKMQENLTLVVSWNVGENQVMQWAGVDCKPLGWHTERVRCSINNSLNFFWPFICFNVSNYYSHSIIFKFYFMYVNMYWLYVMQMFS